VVPHTMTNTVEDNKSARVVNTSHSPVHISDSLESYAYDVLPSQDWPPPAFTAEEANAKIGTVVLSLTPTLRPAETRGVVLRASAAFLSNDRYMVCVKWEFPQPSYEWFSKYAYERWLKELRRG